MNESQLTTFGSSSRERRSEEKIRILPALPTPYEYALISSAIYSNNLYEGIEENKPEILPNEQDVLWDKGWRLKKFVKISDYIGGIWINEEAQQVVIAHRGSKNITSWITDIESIIQKKPGGFVQGAIGLLKHSDVIACRSRGFRLSSTGHSLGGALAQLCVFWSWRREFSESYFPDMSAIVFDSPGMVDLMNILRSNLESETQSIKINELKIHNFCAMPTIVSTYGIQTGTIWHLSGAEGVRFSFVTDHLLNNITKGFDPSTGYPLNYRQMTDWPQADYSAYSNFISAVEHAASETIKLPFSILNSIYKKAKFWMGYTVQDTWYDQVFRKRGQVQYFLKNKDYRPSLEELQDELSLIIFSHYSTLATEEQSMHTMDIHHFDRPVQKFLIDFQYINEFGEDLNLQAALSDQYGESGWALLNSYRLQKYGDKHEVALNGSDPRNIFDFQRELTNLLRDKGLVNLFGFISNLFENKIKELREELNDIKEGSRLAQIKNTEIQQLLEKLSKVNSLQQDISSSSTQAIIEKIIVQDNMFNSQGAGSRSAGVIYESGSGATRLADVAHIQKNRIISNAGGISAGIIISGPSMFNSPINKDAGDSSSNPRQNSNAK